MERPTFPGPDLLLARLVQVQGAGPACDTERTSGGPSPLPGEGPSREEFVRRLAGEVGLRSHDLFLIAGLALPDDAWRLDEEAGRALPALVKRVLTLPASGRRRLRDRARSLAEVAPAAPPRRMRSFEQYPPGFGSLLVRMLALRNLGWSSAAKVMYVMSGVYLSAATIGAVGRGDKELDPELLGGFAAVHGVPLAVLASLTGMPHVAASCRHPEEVIDTAGLLWDVRHLSAEQVRHIARLAD